MLSTDQMKEDFLIRLETMPRILPQQYPFHQLPDIKSLSSTRQITPRQMYSCSYGHPLKNSQKIADSYSPAIIRIKSLNPSIRDVLWLSLVFRKNLNKKSLPNSSTDLTGSWTENGFKLIRKSSQNSSTNTSQTGEES